MSVCSNKELIFFPRSHFDIFSSLTGRRTNVYHKTKVWYVKFFTISTHKMSSIADRYVNRYGRILGELLFSSFFNNIFCTVNIFRCYLTQKLKSEVLFILDKVNLVVIRCVILWSMEIVILIGWG